jgi:rod shape-determining protein MreD
MAILLAIPILGGLIILQTVVVSNLPLLNGYADFILLAITAWGLRDEVKSAWWWGAIGGLMVSFVSAQPFLTPLVGYLIVLAIARFFQHRVWQSPFLTMLVVTFIGTLVYQAITFAALTVTGVNLQFELSLSRVVLPSLLLNMAFALPAYVVMRDLAQWVYPIKVE